MTGPGTAPRDLRRVLRWGAWAGAVKKVRATKASATIAMSRGAASRPLRLMLFLLPLRVRDPLVILAIGFFIR